MMPPILRVSALAFGLWIMAACDQPLVARNATHSDVPSNASKTDETDLGGKTLSLSSVDGRCFLSGHDGERREVIVPTAPCYFARRAGVVQRHSYPKVGVSSVVVVVGTPMTGAEKQRFGVPSDASCGMMSQGVLLRGARIVISKHVGLGGVACRDSAPDEKDYSGFAHFAPTSVAAIQGWYKRRAGLGQR